MAPLNIDVIFATLLTSHEARFWLKDVAPLNIDSIFTTLLTSHEARFWLKDVTPLNMRRILVTPGNVQPDMSSLKAWYSVCVHTAASNNCTNEVKLGSKVQSLMGPKKQIQTHLCKRNRKHKRAVVAVVVAVAAVVVAVVAAVAVVTAAARAGA